MSSLRVLIGDCSPQSLSCPENHAPKAYEESGEHLAYWNQTDVPPGLTSIPALLAQRLPHIRAELVTLVYELGRLRVPPHKGQEVQEQLKAGADLSLWWCSLLFEKHPKVTADLYPALKARALEMLIVEQGYSHIILDGKDEQLRTALSAFCAATGRKFCHEHTAPHTDKAAPSPKHSLARRAYYALPGPAKALLRYAGWWWQLRRHLPRTHSPAPAQHNKGAERQATIATYFPNIDPDLAAQGRFRSRYWESLHDALEQSSVHPRIHWLFMLFPSPQYSTRQCLRLRDAFAAQPEATADGSSFHFVEEFLYTRDLAAACGRYLRLLIQSLRLQSGVRGACHIHNSAMNLWPWLGASFADSFRGWRCLERCLHHIAFSRYVEWAGPQEWTIFPLENCPWERMLTHAVHSAHAGKVWGTQHSTVRPTDFRYFDDPRTFSDPDCALFQPDLVCGNGQGACEEMQAAGLPPERMGMVEALRYMYLHEAAHKAAGQAQKQPAPAAKPRLLIVTSFFADEVADHMRVVADACRAGLLANWQVTIKAHPYLSVDAYLQELPEHDFCRSTSPIGSLLSPGTVVWASNSTTVALEAAVQGLPVMVQLPADDVDLCPLQSIAGVTRIANVEHVRAALQSPCGPQQARIAPDYLALDPALPRWKKLLGL